ncbi:bifunctional (p)ppGpp synthetase/guanosine-3',5'-bis(diphosphate) 3'-pyrophosphohydrolase [Campylobacter sp. RM9344]|uniref:Bifunctional (P)ppGpp synthetase/guanosine-3',5'-bis(Diphosphate) 3'-pyrophosphohydrolase n=1 Tax=Campylobacter californiensis TaxID=1032243 RepID=A0AAW3ZSV0_9BACT|nr:MULTISPECIES: RelA/SpoT family protein [unclassified Campylobacter]MBE2984850.1 bifunctional (p)ppGpp synthetase/guanosine-3',5'-bis(diphosphate) 3'-pyrophosphohydrolase [Campylobacter sp. RM6883]MBE2986554.1 bifunctional (p)ppGpp synthetase/guanosine-3',5'-bis(diphosphate) 3'-pyrophosphohydrolase [Campylobacter sp. RM12919]MBE2987754.1 bifunctional (p)ppGpp synthetase/guanosine-3',5'-bis(diphosphate) 3'-pyrophosphohydrolase [Campylobacter sp. RM12920]MBE2994684.1 bifunctional (p)ppGpp synth
MLKNSIFIEELIDEIVACKNVSDATALLFSLYERSELIEKGVERCIISHVGQYRKSGEPYAIHPILVACIVAYMGGDECMIAAALLHDVVEDTSATLEDVRSEFSDEVAKLVEGLTKIVAIREDKLVSSDSNEKLANSALTFRRMLLISIEDVRVLVVKLCDRTHNMLTLEALAPEKQRRIAEETLMVYAPIAHRLGISSIKNILEDLSFKYILPQEFQKIHDYLDEHKQQLALKLNSFHEKVSQFLLQNGFSEGSFEIQKRIKHYYSIYLKMQRKGISIEEVLDLLAIRIIVKEPLDCYLALGNLHINFNPLISRFKDYIALPKQNGYQTIHTTIFDAKSIFEVQIRTYDMHNTAEYGVAAHWKYKNGGTMLNPKLDWLNDIGMQNEAENNPEELYEYAKDSLYIEDIAVYSPKGTVFTLPRGATALDYAYEVHTEVGLYAKEAFINRIKVPLLTELKNGDIVRIVTGDEAKYRCSWISSVKTGKARATIRSFCKQKIKDINNKIAIDILKSAFDVPKEKILDWLEQEKSTKKIFKAATDSIYLQEVANALKKYVKKERPFLLSLGDKYQIKKQKFENIVIYSNHKISNVEFDYCCNPKRGDNIIGFKSGHNVIVHHKLCERAAKMLEKDEEVIFVKWTRNAPHRYKILLNLENRKGALAEFLTYLARLDVNLATITLNESKDVTGEVFVLSIEIAENIDANMIRDKLKERFKIIDFISTNDPYHN